MQLHSFPELKFALLNLIYGGLRLRKTVLINKAFIAKLGWEILTEENNLWVKLIKEEYLFNSSFFNDKSKRADSPIWRHLLQQRGILRKGIRWKVGNGENILFFFFAQ